MSLKGQTSCRIYAFFFFPRKRHSTVDVSVRIEHDLIVTATALVVLGKVGGSIDQRWKMERSFLLKWRVCDLCLAIAGEILLSKYVLWS